MLKSMIVAGSLALAGLSMAPVTASAASFGNQADVGAAASAAIEQAQYGYGYRRYRRHYGYRSHYRPRFYGYGYRPRYRYYGY